MALAPKVPVEDRLEIMELFAKYAWALNTGDADAVVALFAEDGYLEHLPQGRFSGEDIRTLQGRVVHRPPAPGQPLHHDAGEL
jgi:hypothetical protein